MTIARDIQKRIDFRIQKLNKPGLSAENIVLDPKRMAAAVDKYDALCTLYKFRIDYDDADERVNAGKIAALQAVAVLWEAPWIPMPPSNQAASQVAGNINFLFADYIIQEFLELKLSKFTLEWRRRVHGVLGQIALDSKKTGAAAPPEALIDSFILNCELLRKSCR